MYVVPVREKEVTTRLVTAGRRVKLYGNIYPPPIPRVEGGPAPSQRGLLLGPPWGAWSIEVLSSDCG